LHTGLVLSAVTQAVDHLLAVQDMGAASQSLPAELQLGVAEAHLGSLA
jgi:hypothetical protein